MNMISLEFNNFYKNFSKKIFFISCLYKIKDNINEEFIKIFWNCKITTNATVWYVMFFSLIELFRIVKNTFLNMQSM